jgi:ribose transport system ATP-binding protein
LEGFAAVLQVQADTVPGRTVSAQLVDISKTFGGIVALDHVDLDIRRGEIHALVGHNGAGKTTLMKCLTGAHAPDGGDVIIGGTKVQFRGPADAIAAGIGVVYQELSLFPALSVGENVLGAHALGSSWIRWGRIWKVAAEHLALVGLDVDPRMSLSQLSLGQQQLVEIARALFTGANIIVLDEPTSALGRAESKLLFDTLHSLTKLGKSFILVTHILEEVIGNADRVSVLRDGRRVATLDVADVTKSQLVDLMMGREAEVLRSTYEGDLVTLPVASTTTPVLEISGLVVPPMVRGVDLTVRKGEIVGVYGDLGCGHFQLAEAVFGLWRPTAGTIASGSDRDVARSPTHARDAGIGFLPADRRKALAAAQPIYRNVTLASLHRIQGQFLNPGLEQQITRGLIDQLAIANANPERNVGFLSGGNQQKVLLARWLVRPPTVLVLIEPTRGMDVGAKSEVIRIIQRLQADGVGILLVSTEPETVLAAAQRVLVMHRGRIVAEYAGRSADKRTLLEAAS